MRKTGGVSRNLTFRYNQLVSEEMDKKKSQTDSKGEMLDKTNGKK